MRNVATSRKVPRDDLVAFVLKDSALQLHPDQQFVTAFVDLLAESSELDDQLVSDQFRDDRMWLYVLRLASPTALSRDLLDLFENATKAQAKSVWTAELAAPSQWTRIVRALVESGRSGWLGEQLREALFDLVLMAEKSSVALGVSIVETARMFVGALQPNLFDAIVTRLRHALQQEWHPALIDIFGSELLENVSKDSDPKAFALTAIDKMLRVGDIASMNWIKQLFDSTTYRNKLSADACSHLASVVDERLTGEGGTPTPEMRALLEQLMGTFESRASEGEQD
jgi:hypothetical protein